MSSTVTKEGHLAIQFERGNAHRPPTLKSQVEQIIAQRGAFRNITEESLEAEINHPKALIDHDAMQDDSDKEVEDENSLQARQKYLWKSRDEMLQKLAYAQNEILSALDFVSLTLSSHSKAAQSSMSPALKEVVQPGTLDSRVVENKQISTKTKTRLTEVSEGWKSESFRSAATKLEQASSRLAKETERQSKYWEQIAALKSRGWAISRLPADSRSIGVHFGFQESAPQFRSRGFALLEQDDLGNLDLDASPLKRKIELVKFAIVRNGIETASYMIPFDKTSIRSDIHTRLQCARDALFEEELFYEISREARLIANQDVRTRTGIVEAVVGDDYSIKIVQAEAGSSLDQHESKSDYHLARLIAFSARLLLIAEHTRIHQRRSQTAVLMTLTPPSVPEFAILRPILTQLRHQENMKKVLNTCQKISQPLKDAGLELIIRHERSPESVPSPSPHIALLRKRAQSSVYLEFPGSWTFRLLVETYLGSPNYGTIFENDQISYKFAELKPSTMHSIAEVYAFITHMVSLELVSQTKIMADNDNPSSTLRWTLVRPHSGEFLVNRSKSNVAKINISIESGTLLLGVLRTKAETEKLRKMAFAWSSTGFRAIPSDDTQAGSKTLKEVINDLNQSF